MDNPTGPGDVSDDEANQRALKAALVGPWSAMLGKPDGPDTGPPATPETAAPSDAAPPCAASTSPGAHSAGDLAWASPHVDQLLQLLVAQRVGELAEDVEALQRDAEADATPEHEWDGSSLRFRQRGGRWGRYTDLRGPRGIAVGSGSSGELDRLPLADAAPEAVYHVVYQNGRWRKATAAQMRAWLGVPVAPPTVSPVTVGGASVTVNGVPVTVTRP